MILYIEYLGHDSFVGDAMVTRIRNHLKKFQQQGLRVVPGLPGDDQTGAWVLFNINKHEVEADRWSLEIITAEQKSEPKDMGSSFILHNALTIMETYYK